MNKNRIIHTLSTSRTALILLLATLLTATAAQTAWAEWTGTGTSADPYIISTPEDLLLLAHRVNGTSGETVNTYQGKYFKLGADITFAPNDLTLDEGQSNYEAIGHYDGIHEFKGNFNGDGYTVSGIRINKTGSGDAYSCQGLFGLIASGAEIHDVHLTDARITGYDYVAGIVAYNFGTVSGCTVTDTYITYNAFDHGTICACNGGTLTNNYYHGCTVNGTAVTSGKGCYGSDITANNGALPAYAITFGDGVSTTALASAPENGFVYNGVSYYREGLALPLASTHASEVPAGYTLFSANGTAFSGSDYTVNATDGDVTITTATAISIDPAQFSQDGDTYTINTAGGWNVFCDLLAENTKGYFSGKTVKLGDNITVSRMAGNGSHDFTGTFDGQGKTLTVDYNTSEQYAAPFRNAESGCVIENLHVAGTIVTSAQFAAGIIGNQYGSVTIQNCRSSVTINSTVSGDGTHGGLVAVKGDSNSANLTIDGCVFDGKIVSTGTSATTDCGGFVGYKKDSGSLTITNSLYAPTADDNAVSSGATFARNWTMPDNANIYYSQTLGAAQGKAICTVTAGTDVTIEPVTLTGTPTQYTVSGITAYSGGGLKRGETLYYGSGDQLSLTLSNTATGAPLGYRYDGYTASAGTLSGTTLTMPDEDVTISVNTAALAPIDWATVNQGDSEDPYMIYNKDQLLLLAHRVNGTNGETANEYEGKYFKLGADITFDPDADEGGDYDENYEAIGGYYNSTYRYFNGKFDGDGYTVSGIRIRKTGNGAANSNQGLFGRIDSGADIHDVHLTDARIIGYLNVGGIAGYNDEGYISGCSVTDSYITATSNYYGTICGRNNYTYRLTNNYYHGCTVNSTAATSGVGCEGVDITDNNGALPAYAITLGANITIPPGTFAGQTEWLDTPPVDARLAPENGFTLAGNHYFASGYVFTPGSTLASGAAQGYTPRAILGSQLLDLYTPTGDAPDYTGTAIARLTITADCDGKTLASTEAIYSTGKPVTVAYIKADGTTQTAPQAIALDGHETLGEDGRVSLAAGTYYVGTDIAYATQILPAGDVTLILADGKTMTLYGNTTGIDGYKLTIYGQSLDDATAGTLRYDGKSVGILVSNYEQHSGNVRITTTGSLVNGIYADDVTLLGGTLTITANGNKAIAIRGIRHSILGGQLTATATGTDPTGILALANDGTAITLGWNRPADRITASSISAPDAGTVAVKDGQALTDGSGNIYTGTLTASVLSGFAAETTLQPCLVLNETDGVTPLTALAGQANVPVIFTRSGLTANAYSTMCLPFGFEKPSDCTFYEFKGVGWSSANNQWEATISETSTLAAHTPYIFKCSDTEATFIGTIASVPTDIEASLVEVGASQGDDTNWKFKGTYTALDWKSANPSEPTYGFSTYVSEEQGNKENIAAGTFVRFVKGASLAPFRARLVYSGSDTHLNARGHSRAAQAEGELPRYIIVRIIGADGTATAIGTLDTTTGQLSTDEWYTLGGRRLEAKPNAKGIYIHNGRKVIVK